MINKTVNVWALIGLLISSGCSGQSEHRSAKSCEGTDTVLYWKCSTTPERLEFARGYLDSKAVKALVSLGPALRVRIRRTNESGTVILQKATLIEVDQARGLLIIPILLDNGTWRALSWTLNGEFDERFDGLGKL